MNVCIIALQQPNIPGFSSIKFNLFAILQADINGSGKSQLHEAATDCLCAALYQCEDMMRYGHLAQYLCEHVVLLHEPYKACADQSDTDRWVRYKRVLSTPLGVWWTPHGCDLYLIFDLLPFTFYLWPNKLRQCRPILRVCLSFCKGCYRPVIVSRSLVGSAGIFGCVYVLCRCGSVWCVALGGSNCSSVLGSVARQELAARS